jgi:hypothetical protein
MCQWATPNWINEREFKAQIKAFTEVFTYCQLWYLNEYSTILVGSNEPIRIDFGRITRRFQNTKAIEDLKNINMTDPYMFTAQYSMDKDVLTEYCKGTRANTDNFPVVEFSTMVNIAPDTSALRFIAGHQVDYHSIIFDSGNSEEVREELISKMQLISKARMYTILDIAKDVGRQARAFKMNNKGTRK